MFKPVALYIGLRYTRAKRRTRFISFISLVSMLGIALGVTALITVLSVMNGFNYEISRQFFAVVPAITVSTDADMIKIWPKLQRVVQTLPEVKASAPFINGKGMLMNQGLVSGVEVMGVLPSEEKMVSAIPMHMLYGTFHSLQPGTYRMVIGATLAANLRLNVGDTVNLFVPQTTSTPFGVLPRFRQFTVSGIFKTGSGFGFDEGVGYIHMLDAKKLYSREQAVSGLHVTVQHPLLAPETERQLHAHFNDLGFSDGIYTANWTRLFGAFFQTLAMEKTMMFVILLLIVAVAAFNLVATLMMTVDGKRRDIAILRTMGARPATIVWIFMIQGGLIGLMGTCLGMVLGVVLALNATALVDMVQRIFHVQFISAAFYFIDYLPSRLEWRDVMHIAGFSFLLSILATLYPAWVASRTRPAEALRYDGL